MPSSLKSPRRVGMATIALALLFGSAVAYPASLMCVHLPQLFEFYLRQHYSVKTLTDPVKQHTIDQYLKDIDASKTLFLEEDMVKLRKDMAGLFGTMKAGNCGVLENSSKLMLTRAKENEEFVRKFLGDTYKLDETTEILLDPKKREFPKTAAEKQEFLKKMVHFQISNYLLADLKLPEAKKQLVHRYELITKRISERKPEDIFAIFAESFAQALDPHSSFLSKDSMEDFQIQMQLSLDGIGASLTSQDGFTVIEELIPGGGAEKSKQLQPKDKIIAVTQQDGKPVTVIDMDLRDVVKLIRGKKGTTVRLTILRQAETTKTLEVSIVRDKIDIKEQAAKLAFETRKVKGKTVKIGVIDLPSFYGGGEKGTRFSSVDTQKLLVEAKKAKVEGIVLNLSRNGGGLLQEAVKISGLFLKKGGVVATKDNDTKVQVLADEDNDVDYGGPLIVLTSRLSASASEILAGSLRDYKRAIVVGGDHTFGKGSVQVISSLPFELGGMKVTTGMFFVPGGESTQRAGVPSDIQLPSVFNTEEIGESALDYALPAQAIQPFLSADANSTETSHHWDPVDAELVKKLAEKSAARVAKSSKFAEIKKNIEESARNQGVVKLADLRKKSEEEKKTEKKEKDKSKNKKDASKKELDSPVVQESVDIMADLLSSR